MIFTWAPWVYGVLRLSLNRCFLGVFCYYCRENVEVSQILSAVVIYEWVRV
jgi:hypothetical protein